MLPQRSKDYEGAVHDLEGSTLVSEVGEPTAGPGEVLIQVAAAGLCGTDRHIVEGSHGCSARAIVLGHEVSGTVTRRPCVN
ncbi:alcohol dehydrogenase catalytic domain-containing protein [Paenarthrobacter sp. NPDC091669]|uniref:alcohol dehydrogenase catalytic domain-containing protein n=1 Tax=Paenarthrobacter sp. NPDC091669 TaxID=3364384 RepID=UPI003816AAF7